MVTCASVNRNPPELTFELSYCQGDLCRDASTQADCESRDVVTECGRIASGTDGKADCRWIGTSGPAVACQPNK